SAPSMSELFRLTTLMKNGRSVLQFAVETTPNSRFVRWLEALESSLNDPPTVTFNVTICPAVVLGTVTKPGFLSVKAAPWASTIERTPPDRDKPRLDTHPGVFAPPCSKTPSLSLRSPAVAISSPFHWLVA